MEIFEAIHKHRSIRKYKPDPVPDELLTEIFEAGIRASSSGNMQVYSIIVTRDQALREQLSEAHFDQPMVLDAPVHVTFCADFNRMKKWLEASDAPFNFDNFMSFMIAAIDATLVSQNVALAAEARGLGFCYMGTILANCHKFGEILNLPPGVVPVVGFSLGYPDEDPEPRDRLPLEGILHQETYQDYSPERAKEIYREKEISGWDRYMADDWLREMISKHDVKNLAQVYTIVKYTREEHQEFSQHVLNFITDQNYMENE